MELRRLTLTALFAALCVAGGLIKIPFGIGSAALDTVPALVSVLFLPPVFSGIASMIGHIGSALYAGFPLGPLHAIVAIEMLVIVTVFARLHRRGYHISKWVFFIVANGLVAPLPFYFILSPAVFIGMLPSILTATIINAAIAIVVLPALKKVWSGRLGDLH